MIMTDRRVDTATIRGYTYGTSEAARSPVTLAELDLLRQTVGLTDKDERYLRMAGELLAPQADAIVDAWRGVIAKQPHLAVYSAFLDGRPNPAYSAASKPRFSRWIVDVCTRPYDQAWLDYQQEIGLRHTRARKNRTDGVESAEHIPLRYLLAFTAVVVLTIKPFLEGRGRGAEEVERMCAAWTRAVMLHVTLWSRAYTGEPDW
jgi:hypothetical protein